MSVAGVHISVVRKQALEGFILVIYAIDFFYDNNIFVFSQFSRGFTLIGLQKKKLDWNTLQTAPGYLRIIPSHAGTAYLAHTSGY